MASHGAAPDVDRAALVAAMQRVAAGDRAGLHDLYRRTHTKLYGLSLRILNSQDDAEDVLQDVYTTVWRKAALYDPALGSPLAWLTTLARNRAIDRLRAAGKRLSVPLDSIAEPVDESASAFDTLAATQDGQRLGACIDELQPRDAALIRTAFFQSTTYAELANRADQPLSTVKTRIRRALMKLRDCLS